VAGMPLCPESEVSKSLNTREELRPLGYLLAQQCAFDDNTCYAYKLAAPATPADTDPPSHAPYDDFCDGGDDDDYTTLVAAGLA
jgi:hypothetical protein